MRKLIVLLRLCLSFGPFYGFKVFTNVFFSNKGSIRLPSIKHPINLRLGTSDFAVFEQIFLYNEYNLKFGFEPKVIIDAGSNIGLFAIKLKNRFPDAKIICIEPDSENFIQLSKNLKAYENVFLVNSGLWSHKTKLNVLDKYDQGKWGMIVEEDEQNGTIDAISISDIIQIYDLKRIDVLKLDIESSEKQLFSKDYVEIFKRSKMIIVELHDWMLAGCAKTFFTALNNSLKDYSYEVSGENTIIINNEID